MVGSALCNIFTYGSVNMSSAELSNESHCSVTELAVDFPWALSFLGASLDVGAGGGVCEASGPGDDVQCAVELPVTVAVEPVPVRLPRGAKSAALGAALW